MQILQGTFEAEYWPKASQRDNIISQCNQLSHGYFTLVLNYDVYDVVPGDHLPEMNMPSMLLMASSGLLMIPTGLISDA